MEYFRAGCAVLFAVIFGVSSVSKLRDVRGFARSLPAFAPVPARWITPLAAAVMAAELATAVLVIVPWTATFGFVLAFGQLLAFAVAIGFAVRRGHKTSCRCFGATDTPVSPRHITRNILLAAVAVIGGLAPGHVPPAGGLALAALTGVVAAVLVIAMDDLADLAAVFVRSS